MSTQQLQDRVAAALGDSYALEAEIGRGGMGVVYRCRDLKLRREVAVKVLPPELAYRDEVRTRFLREAETAAQLNHPNIVPIYSVDDRDGLVWFVMALVDGESLAARLAREPRPPLEAVRQILHDVADALSYAHARGIVHRDIKPDNILIDRSSGRPMVSDFGIARAIEGDSRLTITGSTVGTPAYMSPEQATGERVVDGRSDVYSLAVVGYQMLSGELPFQASNTPAMLMKHINEPVPPLRALHRDVPPVLAATIERALEKKPAARFADAAEFRDAIASSDSTDVPLDADRYSGAWKRPAPLAARNVSQARLPAARDNTAVRPRSERGSAAAARDAIDAANVGWNRPAPSSPRERGIPSPPVPAWMPPTWREVRRQWKSQRHDARRDARRALRAGIVVTDGLEQFGELSREERIRRFRRRAASSLVTITGLAGINLMFSPGFPWFVFPAAFLSLRLLHRGASLWGDGIRFRDVFGKEARQHLETAGQAYPSRRSPQADPVQVQMEKLATRDVLEGKYGAIVRRAASDQLAATAALAKLSPADRALIPDVAPTVTALAERVGSIASALHRMDEDVTPDALVALDGRIQDAQKQPESPERARKIELLERQRRTISDLIQRRDTLQGQLDSASLMLQNMRLDLLALGSAGVQSVLNDVSSATQEARALSRDIQIALEAAKEVR